MSDINLFSDCNDLADVFSDVSTHMLVSGIIRDQLTDSRDVRDEALKGLAILKCKSVLDIGCGFGFFTGGLTGKMSQDAHVTGIDRYEKYRVPFLETAKKAGIQGSFISSGISVLNDFPGNSYDLVICSYALYFFPEFIPQISRILKDDGLFIIITHSCPHMKELTLLVRGILETENIAHDHLLPYEQLINRFCDSNGTGLLFPWFDKISSKDIRSEIIFKSADFEKFAEYFRFKFPFFVPYGKGQEKKLTDLVLKKAELILKDKGEFLINKDDTIFICSKPVKNKIT